MASIFLNKGIAIYVIASDRKSILEIGRGHTNPIRMTDITVSRAHAELKIVNGSFYLRDAASKFGTLIQVKRPLEIKPGQSLGLQTGKSKLSFLVNKSLCAIFSRQEFV